MKYYRLQFSSLKPQRHILPLIVAADDYEAGVTRARCATTRCEKKTARAKKMWAENKSSGEWRILLIVAAEYEKNTTC